MKPSINFSQVAYALLINARKGFGPYVKRYSAVLLGGEIVVNSKCLYVNASVNVVHDSAFTTQEFVTIRDSAVGITTLTNQSVSGPRIYTDTTSELATAHRETLMKLHTFILDACRDVSEDELHLASVMLSDDFGFERLQFPITETLYVFYTPVKGSMVFKRPDHEKHYSVKEMIKEAATLMEEPPQNNSAEMRADVEKYHARQNSINKPESNNGEIVTKFNPLYTPDVIKNVQTAIDNDLRLTFTAPGADNTLNTRSLMLSSLRPIEKEALLIDILEGHHDGSHFPQNDVDPLCQVIAKEAKDYVIDQLCQAVAKEVSSDHAYSCLTAGLFRYYDDENNMLAVEQTGIYSDKRCVGATPYWELTAYRNHKNKSTKWEMAFPLANRVIRGKSLPELFVRLLEDSRLDSSTRNMVLLSIIPYIPIRRSKSPMVVPESNNGENMNKPKPLYDHGNIVYLRVLSDNDLQLTFLSHDGSHFSVNVSTMANHEKEQLLLDICSAVHDGTSVSAAGIAVLTNRLCQDISKAYAEPPDGIYFGVIYSALHRYYCDDYNTLSITQIDEDTDQKSAGELDRWAITATRNHKAKTAKWTLLSSACRYILSHWKMSGVISKLLELDEASAAWRSEILRDIAPYARTSDPRAKDKEISGIEGKAPMGDPVSRPQEKESTIPTSLLKTFDELVDETRKLLSDDADEAYLKALVQLIDFLEKPFGQSEDPMTKETIPTAQSVELKVEDFAHIQKDPFRKTLRAKFVNRDGVTTEAPLDSLGIAFLEKLLFRIARTNISMKRLYVVSSTPNTQELHSEAIVYILRRLGDQPESFFLAESCDTTAMLLRLYTAKSNLAKPDLDNIVQCETKYDDFTIVTQTDAPTITLLSCRFYTNDRQEGFCIQAKTFAGLAKAICQSISFGPELLITLVSEHDKLDTSTEKEEDTPVETSVTTTVPQFDMLFKLCEGKSVDFKAGVLASIRMLFPDGRPSGLPDVSATDQSLNELVVDVLKEWEWYAISPIEQFAETFRKSERKAETSPSDSEQRSEAEPDTPDLFNLALALYLFINCEKGEERWKYGAVISYANGEWTYALGGHGTAHKKTPYFVAMAEALGEIPTFREHVLGAYFDFARHNHDIGYLAKAAFRILTTTGFNKRFVTVNKTTAAPTCWELSHSENPLLTLRLIARFWLRTE